jgi:hypothetical protein
MPETQKINGHEVTEPRLSKIYEQTYKVGATIKTINFEAENDLDADEKSIKYVRFLASSMTAKVVRVGVPKKFAIDVDEEIIRLKKLIDSGRSPFY